MRIDTKVLHTGFEFDQETGAVSVPIYQVSTYKQDGVGEHRGWEYSRTGNPTRHALEETMAGLENGVRGLAFGSGMAATSTFLSLFSEGSHVIVSDDLYGGTFRVMDKVFTRFGFQISFVDTSEPENVRRAIRPETKCIFLETPTNPTMKLTDLQAIAGIVKGTGILLAVDNTFMTPYLQRPLDLGADVVIHSATKYLGGHSDVVAGIIVVKDPELGERLHFLQNAIGAILGPFDSWLLMRGIKTLGVRLDKQQANALEIARWLQERPEVSKVFYPGLATHLNHSLARTQASGFGAMLSFELKSPELAIRVLNNVQLITLAESLGAVESLIAYPARMTHASLPAERRAELGISDSLVRLSVGIENPADLMEDLRQALEKE